MTREFLRFFCVVLLICLNIIIAKHLQIAKVHLFHQLDRPIFRNIQIEKSQDTDEARKHGAKHIYGKHGSTARLSHCAVKTR